MRKDKYRISVKFFEVLQNNSNELNKTNKASESN